MGASESAAIQVNFNRSSHFYFPGEQVSGNISFRNERDKLRLDEIFVELIGELGYTTQETRSSTDSHGNSVTEHYTDNHHVPFLTVRIPLAQPNDGKHKMIFDRGTYTWPFEFLLSENLPPSSSPNSVAYPYIKYYTRVVLDRPWYKPNVRQIYFLTISPRMNLLHMNGAQQTFCFAGQNRKQLRLQGCLLRGGIVPGQSLSFLLNLHNPEQTKIKKIQATFVQHRKTAFDCHNEIIFCVDLPGLSEINESHLQRTFDLLVPSGYLTPTHTFTTSYHDYSHYITVHYELRLKVEPQGIFTKFGVSIPVIVGTEPTAEQQQQQKTCDFTTPMSISPIFNEKDLPPNYESVIKDEQS